MSEFPMFCCFHNNREIQWTLSFDPDESEHKMRQLAQLDEDVKRVIGLSDLPSLLPDQMESIEVQAKLVMVEVKV